jgi:DNA replication protein DnaC
LLLGQPGCAKTHLAVALATTAVEAGYQGYFTTADDMVNTLVRAKREGTFFSKLKTLTAPSVLVIDDVGFCPSKEGCRRRLSRRQYPLRAWASDPDHHQPGPTRMGEDFGDAVVAAAILDRLMHNAVVFNIKGPSGRMREHHALEQARTELEPTSGRRRR